MNSNLIISDELKPSSEVLSLIGEFFQKFQPIELKNKTKLLLLLDKKSKVYYINCHLDSKVLVKGADLNAVLDSEDDDEYKLNRELYTDTYAYHVMEKDAKGGRSFEDLVVEYDATYHKEKPFKVFGGQHRVKAIQEALKKGVVSAHGLRIYFGLSRGQKVEIATVNNTSITVANDLLDRMQEELLGNELRIWCQKVGFLNKAQNFADKRNAEGIPTVRVARTLVLNYHLGKNVKKGDGKLPVVCSTGATMDSGYRALRERIDWSEDNFIEMGEHFSKLHKLQQTRIRSREKERYNEFINKTVHPCVVASWAFAAGLLQNERGALQKHYNLVKVKSPKDPLNAKALSTARLKGVDPDTYRGLGARMSSDELGRMLEVFLLQATKAKDGEITKKLANAAIQSYEAKKAKKKADKALKEI